MSRGGRRIVWLLAFSTGCIVANIYYVQPLLADIAREFGLSVAQIGIVAMLAQVGTGLGMLFFVPLGDKYERRSLISTLLVGESIALAFAASATNVVWLSLACFCVGAAAATVHVIVPLAAHLAPPKERGRIVGTVLSGLLIGVLLARTFSGIVGAQYGWRTVYWFASALMLALAVTIRGSLQKSQPEVSMKWTALMRSVWSLAREHATLREAALLACLLFLSFSALWTTLVFLLRTPPYHYGTTAAGVFRVAGRVERRRRAVYRPHGRSPRTRASDPRCHHLDPRRLCIAAVLRPHFVRPDCGHRAHRRRRAVGPRREPVAHLQPRAGGAKPHQHLLYGRVLSRRRPGLVPRAARIQRGRLDRLLCHSHRGAGLRAHLFRPRSAVPQFAIGLLFLI